ncbi:MAG TPA: gliding motility-associated C-terminal domain-containing protein [Flavobacteriales bacterium]|nr:gliding motility-associated C-terminal domain-containing protein [Flavobacteriales bacterium]
MKTAFPLVVLAFALTTPRLAFAQNGDHDQSGLIQVAADAPLPSALEGGSFGSMDGFTAISALPVLGERPGNAVLSPTAFTPDGDGLNDKFFPFLAGKPLDISRFQVFDRWGRRLFISTSGEGWDGTMGGHGASMPQGVYVWQLEAWPTTNSEKLELAGSVLLIR